MLSGGVALQAVLSGLAAGAVLGLVGMGFSLVHRLTRVLALAHGDVVVASVLVGVLVVLGATPVAVSPGVVLSVALVVVSLAVGAGLSVLAYLVAVRPFLRAGSAPVAPGSGPGDAVGWVVAAVAGGLLLREGLGLALPRQAYAVPDPLRLDRLTRDGVLALPGGTTLPVRVLGVAVIALVVGVAAERLLVRRRVGTALRAVAEDPQAAALLGVPVERLVLLAFAVAGLLAAVAGLLDAPAGALSVDDGVVLGLKGIAAALLGGLGSLRGALVGGLILGVVEALAVASPALGAAWTDVLPLGVLVAVLAVRPAGLLVRHREPVL